MSVQVQERPTAEQATTGATAEQATAERPAPGTRPATPAAEAVGRWERGWLWIALVLAFGLVVFGSMYVLTMLGGGPGYPY